MSTKDNLSFLFKGAPATGKTPAACTFAEDGPVYLAYFDKKKPVELEKYFKQIIKRPDLLDNIDYDVYGSNNVNEYLNKLIEFATKGCKYIAVITDSLTSMTGAAVNWSLGFNSKGKREERPNTNPQEMIPSWDEYKTETSLIVQAIDISQNIPAHIIWMAHPIPQTRIENSGSVIKVVNTNSLVTYGSKVAGLVPGRFTEIYHFYKEINYSTNPTSVKFLVSTDAIGDEFARTSLDLPKSFDITNKSFASVWKELVKKSQEVN